MSAALDRDNEEITRQSFPLIKSKINRNKRPLGRSPTRIVEEELVKQHRHQCIQNIRQRHDKTIGAQVRELTNEKQYGHILLDPAYHDNLGDTLLTRGELSFFQGINLQVKECLFYKAPGIRRGRCNRMISKSSSEQKIAFWHAGGNWGDLWPDFNKRRLPSIQHLLEKNFTVVGMPQSLYYQNRRNQLRDVRIFKESVAKGMGLANTSSLDGMLDSARSRVTLTWREKTSYEHAVKLYPFVHNVLVPDIAFQLGPFTPIRNNPELRVDILFLLRTDKESVVSSQRDMASINNLLYNSTDIAMNVTYRVADWNDRLQLFNSDDIFNVTTAVELLSLGTVVVCDRLHAAILSYLAGLPFVYLDQTSGKLSKTLTTAFSDSSECLDGGKADWGKAENLENAIAIAMGMLGRSPKSKEWNS